MTFSSVICLRSYRIKLDHIYVVFVYVYIRYNVYTREVNILSQIEILNNQIQLILQKIAQKCIGIPLLVTLFYF